MGQWLHTYVHNFLRQPHSCILGTHKHKQNAPSKADNNAIGFLLTGSPLQDACVLAESRLQSTLVAFRGTLPQILHSIVDQRPEPFAVEPTLWLDAGVATIKDNCLGGALFACFELFASSLGVRRHFVQM